MGCLQPKGKRIIKEEAAKADFRDKYTTGEKLGEGTFGMVFECTKKDSTEKVPTVYAVKMLEHKSSWWGQMSKSQNVQWEVFAQEFEMLRRMEHPNVIRLFDVFTDDHFLYFVMDKYESSLIAAVLPLLKQGRHVLPDITIGEITHQMLQSIVYLHDQNIVHRDVKADNYLVDQTSFKGKKFKVVLTDLSTAKHLETGVFLKEMLGTMQYWAPEIVARYYTHKVDCWAIGVILWCMLTMKFPFNTVQETYTKKIAFRSGCMTHEQFDLVSQLLDKNPANRLSAREASEHAWVKVSNEKHKKSCENTSKDHMDAVLPKEDNGVKAWDDDADGLGFGDAKKAVPDDVKQRRKEAMTDAKNKFDNGERSAVSFEERKRQSLRSSERHVAKGKQREGEAKSYTWWARERCEEKNVPNISTRCDAETSTSDVKDPAREQSGDTALTEPSSVEELKRQLKAFNIDLSKFGVDKAKSIDQLFHELESYECRMLLRGNKLIRVVDLMVLRFKSPKGKYLVEVNQKMPDGRDRPVTRLPAVMRKAGGSGIDMARNEVARLLRQELNTTPQVVSVEMNLEDANMDVMSFIQASGSYPGIETVYRKSFFNATVAPKAPPGELTKLGLPAEGQFSTRMDDGGTTGWDWWTPDKCKQNGVSLEFEKVVLAEMEGFTPLVAEGAWTEEKLAAALQRHGIDTKLFGSGTARSLTEFVTETNSGETRLYSKGKELRRYLDILIVKIQNQMGAYLIETGHSFGQGQKRQRNAFPATKVRPFEDKVWAVRRLLREVDIPFASSKIMFGPRRVEASESPSYPGVTTVYLKQVVQVDLQEIDVSALGEDGMGNAKWFKGVQDTGARTDRTANDNDEMDQAMRR